MGSNSHLSMWHYKWLSNGAFISLICGPLNCDEDSLKVSDVTQEASWNTSCLSFDLRLDLSLKIKAVPISLSRLCPDALTWAYSPSGDFDGKAAYKLAKGGWSVLSIFLSNGYGNLIQFQIFKSLCGNAIYIVSLSKICL